MNPPVRITGMESVGNAYVVSYGWWDHRGNAKKQLTAKQRTFKEMRQEKGNDSLRTVQLLIQKSPKGSAFIDVGAHVGFMTFAAPAFDHPVYAFDPIFYDIQKLCEGLLGNIWSGSFSSSMAERVNLFHMAVGPINKEVVEMIRPQTSKGYFDVASLTSAAVQLPTHNKVKVHVPMMKLDDVIPSNVRVGVVKIDVQGHEEGVLIGMGKMLARTSGFPSAVIFEDDEELTKKTEWTYGNARKILINAGYSCKNVGVDVLCEKQSP